MAALLDVSGLIAAYFEDEPDPTVAAQRVAFGTSGHRGSAFDRSFNESHVLAITQALCDQRRAAGITGPLFLGVDTHALSAPAGASATKVLAANGVEVMLSAGDEVTPTPAVSHAILTHNRGRNRCGGGRLADGIVITPSHNPPRDGGFKYNLPHGGPANPAVTGWIEAAANRHLEAGLVGVKRMPLDAALRAPTTHRHDYRSAYVAALDQMIDMDSIRNSKLRMGVDPMGGAGVHYWPVIAERYGIDLCVIDDGVDPTFGFLPPDWDGQIRMDPASPQAMQRLVALKDRFDLAFACDADHDRHGIVTPGAGLLPPNHYLSVAVDYLFRHRPRWSAKAAIGKTVVSTQLINRVAARLGRKVFEVPVGFKWFSPGLLDGSLGFAGEESAGASFLKRDGRVWTTDKDGIAAALLAAEITAVTGRDPGVHYAELAGQLGNLFARRVDAAATPQRKERLGKLLPRQIRGAMLAGEVIERASTHAPGNGESIRGIKAGAANSWFVARPSGTEETYKVYAESFVSAEHLHAVLRDAQALVDAALGAEPAHA
ncbi:MAG: alpha-D-glucose phosphate-specific phosphoglucomutase [Burkholderiales bacterium]